MSDCTILVDFDGTVTEQETLDLLVARFGDAAGHAARVAELGRSLVLEDVLAAGYGSLAASRDDVVAWLLGEVRVRPGFAELRELARRRGWRFVVLSSGVRELIAPLLLREGAADTAIVSNELEDEGWRVRFRETRRCTVCGERCKRGAVDDLGSDDELVYIGDGYSDGCAALAADRVFARRRLVEYLAARGAAFEPFDDFFDVVRALD